MVYFHAGFRIKNISIYGSKNPPVKPQVVYRNIKSAGVIKNAKEVLETLFGSTAGSNNWVISGEKTLSGKAMLANDPHLSLQQPPIFHEIHLNTKRAGGSINAGGVVFPMAPGIVIGFTDSIAWGETVVGYDVTDFYVEELSSSSKPWRVKWNNDYKDVNQRVEQIAFKPDETKDELCSIDEGIIDEIKEYPVDIGTPFYYSGTGECILPVKIYEVDGHGPIVAELLDETPPALLSVRWSGFEPTYELRAFMGYLRSKNIDDFKGAAKNFRVGAQNQVVIDADGNIGWFPYANIPARDFSNCPYDEYPRYLPIPGTGICEWNGYIPDTLLPELYNPEKGYIVTANNYPAETTYYHGTFYDLGYRASRITELIEDKLKNGGLIAVEDMKRIQGDTLSPTCRDFKDRILKDTILRYEDELTESEKDAFNYVKDWDCSTPSGYTLGADGKLTVVDDTKIKSSSIATSIFHTWYANLIHNTFDDEITGFPIPDNQLGRMIYHITFRKNCSSSELNNDEACQYSGDGPGAQSYFWDNINTEELETRDEIVVKSFKEAVDGLKKSTGYSSASQWLWGRLHYLVLKHLVDTTGLLNVPSLTDKVFPWGFPRPGDLFVVDNADPEILKTSSEIARKYNYSSGPSYRLIVELSKDGVNAYTALPGGNVAIPKSRFYSNQMMDLWWKNEYKKFSFDDKDVKENAFELTVYKP